MSEQANDSCIFCKISRKEIPSSPVFEDDLVYAFRDLAPEAPTHVLVVPKQHLSGLSDARTGDEPLLGHLFLTVARIAREADITAYRTVVNDGRAAGQSVFHLHVHLLAGRPFKWPPG